MSVPKSRIVLSIVLLIVTVARGQDSANPGIKDPSKFDPKRPLSQELQTSVRDGFRLVAVGDCIISRPLFQQVGNQPEFASAVRLLQNGDATYGNLETSILDLRTFKGSPFTGADDYPLVAVPAVAQDLSAMGFDVMSRANNHAVDWGAEGMRETTHWTDEAGIVTAGVGEDQGLARAAGYYESPKGRIAIVSLASTFRPASEALPEKGAAPGRPGINSLAVKKSMIVPADVMRDLTSVARKLYPEAHDEIGKDGKLTLFGAKFETGQRRAMRYDMDETDLAEILKAIRQGKQHSDFLLATIHSHEGADSTGPDPKSDFADTPAEFVHTLAKAAIDAGADAFMTTGIHHLGPIEIYKGRPIFYGLGDFFWSDIQEPMPADFYAQYRDSLSAFEHPEKATDADLENVLNAGAFDGDMPFDSVITESRFDHGRVAEIRLYPIYLGYGMKLTQSGIPRVASPEKGVQILRRLQSISAPYGTKIEIETSAEWHSVGVIRP
jgi:poly-gamma-glutamate capsule biosynthesis protein CapA/YwtB (metallophosphatase superfamily)